MREDTVVKVPSFLVCAALALAAPAFAQQPPSPAAQAAPGPAVQEVSRVARAELRQFETLLQDALATAVQRFAQWVSQVEPGVMVTQSQRPTVHGLIGLDGRLTFQVQQVDLIGLRMLAYQFESRPQGPSQRANNPVTPEPSPAAPRPGQVYEGCAQAELAPVNPSDKYADCVREALIEAILDRSRALTLHPGQLLEEADVPVEAMQSNIVSPNETRTLMLSIKTDDLLLYHQGKLSRDEAIRRIVDRRF